MWVSEPTPKGRIRTIAAQVNGIKLGTSIEIVSLEITAEMATMTILMMFKHTSLMDIGTIGINMFTQLEVEVESHREQCVGD